VAADSAFYTGDDMKERIIKTKEVFENGGEASSMDLSLTHLRQVSEWGNNTLTGVFRRLKNELRCGNEFRALLIWSCVLLHNFRTETVGRNQAKTYFDNLVHCQREEDGQDGGHDGDVSSMGQSGEDSGSMDLDFEQI